ncbi:hypothetical protein EDC04DRAFT_2716275 [Pisolithus marmoratus]|nr:hypothetical protein EDC04DRAFT_2716275 [Pisolithus marmoratus]
MTRTGTTSSHASFAFPLTALICLCIRRLLRASGSTTNLTRTILNNVPSASSTLPGMSLTGFTHIKETNNYASVLLLLLL